MRRGLWWWLACTVTIGLVVLVLSPVLTVVTIALMAACGVGPDGSPWLIGRDEILGLHAYGYLLTHYGSWLLFSLALAVGSVLVCLAVAVPAAWGLIRYPFPGSRWVEQAAALPLSLPGLAVSVGLVAAFPAVRGPWLVFAGHLLFTIPFMLRVTLDALRGYDLIAWERASASLGADAWRHAVWVVLPNLRHALVTGSLLVFAVSWGEFNVSYLLNHGRVQTFPAALYDTFANDGLPLAAAATVLFLVVVIPVSLGVQILGRGRTAVEQGA